MRSSFPFAASANPSQNTKYSVELNVEFSFSPLPSHCPCGKSTAFSGISRSDHPRYTCLLLVGTDLFQASGGTFPFPSLDLLSFPLSLCCSFPSLLYLLLPRHVFRSSSIHEVTCDSGSGLSWSEKTVAPDMCAHHRPLLRDKFQVRISAENTESASVCVSVVCCIMFLRSLRSIVFVVCSFDSLFLFPLREVSCCLH